MKSAEARAWFEMLIPILIGLAIAGTGGWSADRWATALAIMGLGVSKRVGQVEGDARGYERGFNTYNPALREPANSEPFR